MLIDADCESPVPTASDTAFVAEALDGSEADTLSKNTITTDADTASERFRSADCGNDCMFEYESKEDVASVIDAAIPVATVSIVADKSD